MTAMESSEEVLRRLCEHLEHIADRGRLSGPELDALRKAGAAIQVVFYRGLMDEVDRLTDQAALTPTELAKLRSLEIEP